MDAAASRELPSEFDKLLYARQILQTEIRTLTDVAARLDHAFCDAADYLYRCRGSVIVSGMGKAGLVGQKITATLASTGTRSHCLHPAEAVHGDLGRVHPDDVMLLLSQSGETEEVLRLLGPLQEIGVPILAVTGRADSTLARAATVTIDLGPMEEACRLGLAPSSSTTAMLAVGDALALVVSRMRGFSREDFARFHPAGNLGRKLSKVDRHMRPLAQCRLAREAATVREVFVGLSVPGRRSGAIMLVDDAGRLSGIFTDSDLARLFERRREAELDGPMRNVMTPRPTAVTAGAAMADAVQRMAHRKISELPVVDGDGKPVGLIDVTDVLGLLPRDEVEPAEAVSAAEGRAPEPPGVQRPTATPAAARPVYRVYPEPDDAHAP
jgi:arabinose-5-phosphate isomerase